MPVDDGQVVVVVLLGDKAAGVLAEGPHLVAEGRGIAHQLAFVQGPVDHFHDLVAGLHPDADVHRAGLMGDAVLDTQLFQPVRPAPPRGDHHGFRPELAQVFALRVFQADAQAAAVLQNEVGAGYAEANLDPVGQEVLLDVPVEPVGLFGAQVADRAVHELEAGADGAQTDVPDLLSFLRPFHVLVRPEVQINPVRIADHFLGVVAADQLRQHAAHVGAQGQLAVRKSAGPGKAGGNVAIGLAVHAAACFGLGTGALFDGSALFDHDDLLAAALAEHLQGGKNPRRPCADDDDVCFHSMPLSPRNGLRFHKAPRLIRRWFRLLPLKAFCACLSIVFCVFVTKDLQLYFQ